MRLIVLKVFMFLFILFQTSVYSQFNGDIRTRLNQDQPISIGQNIYEIIKDGTSFNHKDRFYYVEQISYIFKEIKDRHVVVLHEYLYLAEDIYPDKIYKVTDMILPLNQENEAYFATEDKKLFRISVLDGKNIVACIQTKENTPAP